MVIFGNNKAINLKNTSTIILDEKRSKVIFNFENSIDIVGRLTPDYTTIDCDTPEEAREIFEEICNTPWVKENFFIPKHSRSKEIVNKNSFTTIVSKAKRIIFNLNYSITVVNRGEEKLISKFVYWDYDSEEQREKDEKMIFEKVDKTNLKKGGENG